MLKPITLKPIAYVSLSLVVLLLIAYLLFRDLDSPSVIPMIRYEDDDPIFNRLNEAILFEGIKELLNRVEKHQEKREYQAVIDILRETDIDKLVAAELTKSPPLFVVIAGEGLYPYGLEDEDRWGGKYKFIVFPGTSDTIDGPEYWYWYHWAEDFARRYNSKLEIEWKKKGR